MSAHGSRYVRTLLIATAALLCVCVPSAFALPAGRGYEKATPADKDGQDMIGGGEKAAADGNAVASISYGAFGDSEGAGLLTSYYSARSATAWDTVSLGPPQEVFASLASSLYQDYSEDLATSIVEYQGGDPELDGATPGTNNIYRRDPDGTLHLLSPNQPPLAPGNIFAPFPTWGGGPNDMSFGTFNLNTDPASTVTSGPAAVPAVDNAFVSTGPNDLRLVSVLPNGDASPNGGIIGGTFGGTQYNAVSDDGSRIFWSSSGGVPNEVYVRVDGTDTVHVSASQRNNPDPNGVQQKLYQYATPDGRFVYFTSGEKLTNNSQAEPGLSDLYRYDVQTDTLVDLTTADGDGAGVMGVIGAGDNGNRVYFAASGVLAPGAVDGETNLYVRSGSQTTFITGLDLFGDGDNWSSTGSAKTGRVSANGEGLMFSSRRQQLGYDNAGHLELYLYDAGANEFGCLSCNPNGAAATSDAALSVPPSGGILFQTLNVYERRNLSTDGSTAFFSSQERLVPSDTNGKYDAYMWKDGETELVSTGHSENDSLFMDASRSGDDAFFLTREQLVGTDTDDSVDLYDARVGGGLASQNPPPPPPPCEGDACKPPATPQGGPPPNGTTAVDNPVVPPPPDCSSAEAKAEKKAKKVDKLQKKVGKASGKQKRKLKKKLKKAKKAAKKAERQADQCNQG